MTNNVIDKIINFDIEKAVTDYTGYLRTEDAESVMNNILLNYGKNLETIIESIPLTVPDDQIIIPLRMYSARMVELWRRLRVLHEDQHFEFSIENPFLNEMEKDDRDLAQQLFS